MTLCITEKRDVAEKIARYIGATEDRKDYFEGNGYYITWCRGHLLELRVPEAEGRWTLSNLPILPERFMLGPISTGRDKEGNLIEDPGVKHRLAVIRKLMQQCDDVVNCADAAREGQLIFENVYRYIGIRKQCRRLWISSLMKKDILDGFSNLQDNRNFEGLGKAARLRSEGDWMVGINATRAFTLTANAEKPLSLGRVQTPTLCMICERYVENKNFKSEPFWHISGETTVRGVSFRYKSDDTWTVEQEGKEAYDSVIRDGKFTVESVSTERKNEEPPLLHDLASLQKIANSKYGLTAKQTLDAAQSLYEKQLTSYPRTSSRYISESIFQEMRGIMEKVSDYPAFSDAAKRMLSGSMSRRSVNETKLTDHHGLIVTGKYPGELSINEEQVYELILGRCIEAFSPVCVVDATVVELSAGDVSFTVRGRRELVLGWRTVFREDGVMDGENTDVDEIEMTMTPLPQMVEGETIPLGQCDFVRDYTKPKPLLTDSTLITKMENAGRRVEDKSIAKALKGIGIGTSATRQDVIEEIIKREYVFRDKRKLVPTELGLSVYKAIKDKEIANAELTAKWESALNDIAEGEEDAAEEFNNGIRQYTIEITDDIRMDENIRAIGNIASFLTIRCPKCGKTIRVGAKGGRCECGFSAWRVVSGKTLSDEQMKQLYERGKTELIKGFKAKSGGSFNAALVLKEDGLSFSFPEEDPDSVPACPKCGKPMRFSQKSCWCPECRFAVWRTVAGKTLSDSQLSSLIKKGRTGKLSGFVSKAGKPFEAFLVMDGEGKVNFEFENRKK